MFLIIKTYAEDGTDQESIDLPISVSWHDIKYNNSPSAGNKACLNLISLRLAAIKSSKPCNTLKYKIFEIVNYFILFYQFTSVSSLFKSNFLALLKMIAKILAAFIFLLKWKFLLFWFLLN